jgi:hypothetical protein
MVHGAMCLEQKPSRIRVQDSVIRIQKIETPLAVDGMRIVQTGVNCKRIDGVFLEYQKSVHSFEFLVLSCVFKLEKPFSATAKQRATLWCEGREDFSVWNWEKRVMGLGQGQVAPDRSTGITHLKFSHYLTLIFAL